MPKKPKRYPRRHLLCFSHLHAAMLSYLETIESSTSFSDHVRRALEVYTLAHPAFDLEEFRRFARGFSESIGDERAEGEEKEDRNHEIDIYLEQLKSLVAQCEEEQGGGPVAPGDLMGMVVFESSAEDF